MAKERERERNERMTVNAYYTGAATFHGRTFFLNGSFESLMREKDGGVVVVHDTNQ